MHADWQIRCDTPPGAQGEQCALIQSVTAEDRANVGLTVIVLKTADQKSRLMRVVAPMGVLLPSGLGLKIDQADVGRAGFVRCLPNGCVAEVMMDADVVVLRAVPPQAIEGAAEESRHDLVVEAARHDREAEPLGVQIAFERTWHAAADYMVHVGRASARRGGLKPAPHHRDAATTAPPTSRSA